MSERKIQLILAKFVKISPQTNLDSDAAQKTLAQFLYKEMKNVNSRSSCTL